MGEKRRGQIELADWLAEHYARRNVDSGTLRVISAMLQLGLDPMAGDEPPTHRSTSDDLLDLARSGWKGDPQLLRDVLPLVGVRVITECDADEAHQWAAVARMWPGVLATYPDPPYEVRDTTARDLVNTAYRAGHAPSWLASMIRTAGTHGCDPLLIGFSDAASPALLTDAATAGLSDRRAVAALTGGDAAKLAPMLPLITEGAAPGAIIAARATGLGQHEWSELLPGLPARWFPTPVRHAHNPLDDAPERMVVEQGMIGAGWTWDELALLHERGWDDLTADSLRHRYRYHSTGTSRGNRTIQLTKEQLLHLTTLGPETAVRAMLKALTDGSRSDGWRDTYLPPLCERATDTLLAAATALTGRVKPSHLDAYRKAGCRTVDDVLQALDAGITAADCATLCLQHGPKLGTTQLLRLPPGTLIERAREAGIIPTN